MDSYLNMKQIKQVKKCLNISEKLRYKTAEKLAGYPSAKNKLARTSALEWQNPQTNIVQSLISRCKSMHMEKCGILE